MAIQLNAQFMKFVEFANNQTNDKAIARLAPETADGGALATRSISAAKGDKIAPLRRSADNKNANNDVRTLFRDTIAAMFGGENNIPKTVRDAMRLKDYGYGKPLTARRITAVAIEVQSVMLGRKSSNNTIREAVLVWNKSALPESLKTKFGNLLTELRGKFGDAEVPIDATIKTVASSASMRTPLERLCDEATSQLRDVKEDDIIRLYREKAHDNLAAKTLGKFICQKFAARGAEIDVIPHTIGYQFDQRNPGLLAQIKACQTLPEIEALLQAHEAEINAFADIVIRNEAAFDAVDRKVNEKLAEAFGLDSRFVKTHFVTNDLEAKMRDLSNAIRMGEAPGSKEPGYDVEGAYDALIDDFVQKRVDAYNAVDALDLPTDVKNRWKADFTAFDKVPAITSAKLLEAVGKININKLNFAFDIALADNGLLRGPAKMFTEIAQDINVALGEVTGNPQFADEGVDFLMPLYGMIATLVEAQNPNLTQKIDAFKAKVFEQLNTFCEFNRDYGDAALFLKTLASYCGATKSTRVTNEIKYLALIENDVAAKLKELDITDPKVCEDVKTVMKDRARAKLAKATTLKEMSDHLAVATPKEFIGNLARTLAGINVLRNGAGNIAVDMISSSTGLEKEVVQDKLSVGRLTSDNGSIDVIYADVMEKARNAKDGEAVDFSESVTKTSSEIGKFASDKISLMNEIDKLGMKPLECGKRKKEALLSDLSADKWLEMNAARTAKEQAIVAKYAPGLAEETKPLLTGLVKTLDWISSDEAAKESEDIVKGFVKDMAKWRNIAPGSNDAKSLDALYQRRFNDYVKDVLAGKTNDKIDEDTGLFPVFVKDLKRAEFTINGVAQETKEAQEMLPAFKNAIKDKDKLKFVSIMINQQLFADHTTLGSRVPLVSWKKGMPEVDVDTIPGIDSFATRTINDMGGQQLLGTGQMKFSIDVSPDEKTVKVQATNVFMMNSDLSAGSNAYIGKCSILHDFTIDFTGPEPVIKDFKVGQTLQPLE